MEAMMKKLLTTTLLAAATLALATAAQANDTVKLQMKWVTQAQFAGYYVAASKGYYKDEGLDVTILPGGPDIAPEQVILAPPRWRESVAFGCGKRVERP